MKKNFSEELNLAIQEDKVRINEILKQVTVQSINFDFQSISSSEILRLIRWNLGIRAELEDKGYSIGGIH